MLGFGRRRFLSFPFVIGAAICTRYNIKKGNFPSGPRGTEIANFQNTETRIANMANFGIGVVSGKAIFGPPLEEYWKNKLQEDAAGADKKTDASST